MEVTADNPNAPPDINAKVEALRAEVDKAPHELTNLTNGNNRADADRSGSVTGSG